VTEHLLLALMREEVLLPKLINQRGSAEGLRQKPEGGIQTTRQPISTSADLPLSREAGRVVARADEEAEMLEHHSIDSTRLVLRLFAVNAKPTRRGITRGSDMRRTARRWPVRRSVPPRHFRPSARGLFPSLLWMTPLAARRLLRPCGQRFPSRTEWWRETDASLRGVKQKFWRPAAQAQGVDAQTSALGT
jgi:hypothetical protein